MTVGLGCMRLSTAPDRDDVRSAEVLAAAIAAGVDLLDTADAYAHDDRERGHNERLIAAAIAGTAVQVVTKGGLTRPDGAWLPDGRARHLEAAARASRDRLGVAALDVYLLHAVDPRTPLATSVRALARIRDAGLARTIGLSNVTLTQLEAALALAPIEVVEVELHPWKLDALRGGLVAACAARGIRVLAHRPLGGPTGARRAARDPVITAHAARLGASPAELVLAWLRSLSPAIVPLPGATRPATATSAARSASLDLDAAARTALAGRFLEVHADPLRDVAPPRSTVGARTAPDLGEPVDRELEQPRRSDIAARTAPDLDERPPRDLDERREVGRADREIVMIVGMPASGKTTLAADYVARGYLRLNRDVRGGSLLDLARALDGELAAGASRVVIDNTYPTRGSRAPVLEVARGHGVPVRCLAMATALEDAQANAVLRMLELHGRLLQPAELARASREAGAMLPSALFRYRREYEPPRLDEGFASLDEQTSPRRTSGTRRALILELDNLVWRGRPRTATAIELRPDTAAVLAGLASPADAWDLIAGTTWQPGLDESALAALGARLAELLAGLVSAPLTLLACTHPAGPPICWCRKPMPGLALAFARAYDVDLARSLHVGRGAADRGFARRAGIPYRDLDRPNHRPNRDDGGLEM